MSTETDSLIVNNDTNNTNTTQAFARYIWIEQVFFKMVGCLGLSTFVKDDDYNEYDGYGSD